MRRILSCCLVLAVLLSPVLSLADSSTHVAKDSTPPPVPKAAVVIEGVSAAITGVGILLLGIGASNIGIRNQLACVNVDTDSIFGACEKGNAAEIKQLEDSGLAILTAGWITLGIGVTGMLIGGIWMLSHNPNHTKSTANPQPSQPTTATLPPHNATTLVVITH